MATHIFIDKENGETGTTVTSKDRLRLLSAPGDKGYSMSVKILSHPAKAFVEKSHPRTPLVGRTANVNSAASHTARKTLGNLNRPLSTTVTQFPKGKKFSAQKAPEKTNTVESGSVVTEDCPEKENMFHYNPLDFESFEVPEEHRLSHMPLTGVPLMRFEKTSDRLTDMVSEPIRQPLISWDYYTLQSTKEYLATLDEIMIDLPPPL